MEELKLLSASRTPRMGSVGDEKWRACSRCSTQHTPEWTLARMACVFPLSNGRVALVIFCNYSSATVSQYSCARNGENRRERGRRQRAAPELTTASHSDTGPQRVPRAEVVALCAAAIGERFRCARVGAIAAVTVVRIVCTPHRGVVQRRAAGVVTPRRHRIPDLLARQVGGNAVI